MKPLSARIREHVRSNVIGYVALGGVAWASATIGSSDIKDNAVHSNHIKNGQVKSADLASNSVDGTKVADGSLSGADVNNSQI